MINSRIKRKKFFLSCESSQALSNNHKLGEVSGIRGGIQREHCNARAWMHLCLFSREKSILVFSYPTFSQHRDERVSGGSRMMLYTIGPGQDSKWSPWPSQSTPYSQFMEQTFFRPQQALRTHSPRLNR